MIFKRFTDQKKEILLYFSSFRLNELENIFERIGTFNQAELKFYQRNFSIINYQAIIFLFL